MAVQEITEAKRLADAVAKLNSRAHAVGRTLRFCQDEATTEMVVLIVDSRTGAPVKQLPAAHFLSLLGRLDGSARDFIAQLA